MSNALKARIDSFPLDPASPYDANIQQAIQLARLLMRRAQELQTPQEKRQQAELERMMHHEEDKPTLVQITDQAFRSRRARRAADQLVHILDVQGIPRFFSAMDRTLLKGFQSFGAYLPGVAVPMVKGKMREETANTILPAEPDLLRKHLEARRDEGVRMNVNLLGEALLGEDEARERLDRYLATLQDSAIEVISVKISTIYSQIDPGAHTVHALSDRLERLYRTAAKATFTRADGTEVPKFVYLDMEEYRDQRITEALFTNALSRPGLEQVSAGIALQAYLPDAWEVQQRLTAWARARVAAGGAPVVIRLVKGANMEMERVEAAQEGWPLATYHDKRDTDANFKRMLRFGMEPEHLAAVGLGIASHNLFDLAYALVLAVEHNALDRVQFEMLEGMANHQRRALFEHGPNLLLYAPAARRSDFIHAIGYLIRRLDENTGPENFLRHTFRLEVGTPEWETLEQGFLASFDRLPGLRSRPYRTQDRRAPATPPEGMGRRFANEPDTDWSLPANQAWAGAIRERWEDRHGGEAPHIPLVVNGEERLADRSMQESLDPSRPGTVVARIAVASETDLNDALAAARRDQDGWRTRGAAERDNLLRAAAQLLRERRGDLMGAAMAECAKLFAESDPEVSEAIDFVEYYVRSAADLRRLPGVHPEGLGVVVVVSPCDAPIAVPCGGVAAALTAGNSVIIKPSPDAALTTYRMCECFWDAGVPRHALQFLPTANSIQSGELVSDGRVDLVVLAGGTETAFAMLAGKPSLNLLAETGGKNAIIVTALSDRELAVKHVLQSAFGHAGQKCSAASLLVLEEEVFEDEAFRATLVDGARSLRVGSAWDPRTRVAPLIHPPSPTLRRGLLELEHGESWALIPEACEENPCLYGPGIRWNVKPGSDAHRTEYFGPVLAVMKAHDLDEAIEIVNDTDYGLTSGLASLDEREREIWLQRVQAGNVYVNRGTTGAMVLRQPFGGMKGSALGSGIKAGGPNYVLQFMRYENTAPTTTGRVPVVVRDFADRTDADDALRAALASYGEAYDSEFGATHDDFGLLGQDNIRRYLPVDDMRIRLHPDDSLFEILGRVAAARVARSRVAVSHHGTVDSALIDRLEGATADWGAGVEFVEEGDEELAQRVRERQVTRVRYAHRDRVPPCVFEAAAETGACLCTHPVVAEGRIELLWYLHEQSICHDYHRYGNLGARTDEQRAPVPGCDIEV